jgi:hypothetical protein
MDNFINQEMLEDVLEEFPDLSEIESKIKYNNKREIKFTLNGFADLSPVVVKLISFLNSDLFLNYLIALTGMKEPLFSDGY